MKFTPEQQRELIPNESVRRCFIERLDIATLGPEEQERRWQAHLVKVNEFREFLSRLDCIGVMSQ